MNPVWPKFISNLRVVRKMGVRIFEVDCSLVLIALSSKIGLGLVL